MILNLVVLMLSAAGSVGVWLGAGISPWWLLLLLPAFYIGLLAVYFGTLWLVSLFFPKKGPKRSGAFCRRVIRLSLDWLLLLLRVKISLSGTELLPDCPCVLVSNHRSDFDPLAMLAVLRGRGLIYISKEENFRLPLAGNYIRQAGFLAIDRENGMKAMRTLKQAAGRLRDEGLDVGIYPEGTRSKTGELLDFKSGAFYLAKKADAPIAVMTTQGTERIGKNFPLHSTAVRLHICRIIDRETVRASSLEELSATVRGIIEADLSAADSERH